MKVGERVRHIEWHDPEYGEIVELLPNGRCSVVYPGGRSFSGIPLEAIESVEVELEKKRRDQAKLEVIKCLEAGELASAIAWYERECTDWWPVSEFEHQRIRCIEAIEAREAEMQQQRDAERRLQLKNQIVALLDAENYGEADQLHSNFCQGWWPLNEYEALKRDAMYAVSFAEVYRTSSLAILDIFFKNHQSEVGLSSNDYAALKLPKIAQKLEAMGITLDHEQLCAVARHEDRLLITARA